MTTEELELIQKLKCETSTLEIKSAEKGYESRFRQDTAHMCSSGCYTRISAIWCCRG